MVQIVVLFSTILALAASFKNLSTYDSRPMISILWGLSGAAIGPLLALFFPVTQKSSLKFFAALALMTSMLFFGFGFFAKSQLNKDRFNQILTFPKTQAKLVSCHTGEENPGRHRRPDGRFFPIWNYQFKSASSNSEVFSHSDSLSDFSIRKHYVTESEAKKACESWNPSELRVVYYDPASPELSLIELPKSYRAYHLDLFLGVVFSVISLIGIAALLKFELNKKKAKE